MNSATNALVTKKPDRNIHRRLGLEVKNSRMTVSFQFENECGKKSCLGEVGNQIFGSAFRSHPFIWSRPCSFAAIFHQNIMAKISINLKTGGVEHENEVIIGIDLGTTNSLVAYMKDGQPVCVKGQMV